MKQQANDHMLLYVQWEGRHAIKASTLLCNLHKSAFSIFFSKGPSVIWTMQYMKNKEDEIWIYPTADFFKACLLLYKCVPLCMVYPLEVSPEVTGDGVCKKNNLGSDF